MKLFKYLNFVIIVLSANIIFTSCNDITPPKDEHIDGIYVLEKDHIFGGFGDVDNFHHTLIINTSEDSIVLNVESPTPEGLKRESIRSPAFGKFAFIPTEFSDYFSIPNMANDYLTDEPDTSTQESHFWNNLKLGSLDGIHVPYSNYLGEGEELFIKRFGVNNFMGLEVISEYKIEKDTSNSSYINIEIKQTMVNTTKEKMYNLGISLYIPKELSTRKLDTTFYNIIRDTILATKRNSYYYYISKVNGFGMGSSGQEFNTISEVLQPNEKFDFSIKMIIEPLVEKFEIYPMYLISFETKGERIWPKSIITSNNKTYNGTVDYLKVCGLAIPTYILFSINNGVLNVVSPDEIEPTF